MEYCSADAIHPELNVYDYRAMRTNDIMNDDVTKYTHAIIVDEDEVQTPQECRDMFDSIAYDKAASILKMIDASKEFLRRYEYGNANGDDLIETFTPFYDGYSGSIPA